MDHLRTSVLWDPIPEENDRRWLSLDQAVTAIQDLYKTTGAARTALKNSLTRGRVVARCDILIDEVSIGHLRSPSVAYIKEHLARNRGLKTRLREQFWRKTTVNGFIIIDWKKSSCVSIHLSTSMRIKKDSGDVLQSPNKRSIACNIEVDQTTLFKHFRLHLDRPGKEMPRYKKRRSVYTVYDWPTVLAPFLLAIDDGTFKAKWGDPERRGTLRKIILELAYLTKQDPDVSTLGTKAREIVNKCLQKQLIDQGGKVEES